jgi:ATP-dependent protease ClpP protease subunit
MKLMTCNIFAKILVCAVFCFSLSQYAKASELVIMHCVSSGQNGGGSRSPPEPEGTEYSIVIDEGHAARAHTIFNYLSNRCKNFHFSQNSLPSIRIRGEIKGFMVDFLDNLKKGIESSERFNARISQDLESIRFSINSGGGDVYAAIRIGRILRALNARVIVPHGAVCHSACVIILASGVERIVTSTSRIGLHRPYFANLDHRETRQQVAARLNRVHADMGAYFQEMGQPASLLDAMRAVPPDRIRLLTYDEVENFMLAGEDPIHQERVLAREAHRYGTTSAEMRRRQALAEQMCRTPPRSWSGAFRDDPNFYPCSESIKYAITVQTLLSRENRIREVCGPLLRGSRPEARSLAEHNRVEECVRSVMIGNTR